MKKLPLVINSVVSAIMSNCTNQQHDNAIGIVLLESCKLCNLERNTSIQTRKHSKHANTWAARRPEGSLPGAVHHDLACVHRAGASVGSVSKAPALSPSNWSNNFQTFKSIMLYHVTCSYHVVSRRIS